MLHLPTLFIAQVSTATAAVEAIPGIISAFQSGGVWAGIAAVFALLSAVLNMGPVKTWLDASPADWVRPLVMLVGVGLTAGVGAAATGAGWLAALMAGLAAGLSSGLTQKLVQKIKS